MRPGPGLNRFNPGETSGFGIGQQHRRLTVQPTPRPQQRLVRHHSGRIVSPQPWSAIGRTKSSPTQVAGVEARRFEEEQMDVPMAGDRLGQIEEPTSG